MVQFSYLLMVILKPKFFIAAWVNTHKLIHYINLDINVKCVSEILYGKRKGMQNLYFLIKINDIDSMLLKLMF